MSRPIEPGLLRAFRYFTVVALCYFAILVIYTGIQTGQGLASVQIQWYLNFASNLVLFIYLSWPGLLQRLRSLYLPLALSLAAGTPVLSNLIFLVPLNNNLAMVVEPTWLLFPTLLVTLVLVAWQYNFAVVLVFTVFAAVVELVTLFPLSGGINAQTLPLLGLPLVRAFAFGIVGQVVCHLMARQRAQRHELIYANIQLGQHAAALEQLTVSRERNRLARELHDTLAHTLSGQAVNLEAIKLMLPPDQVEIQGMLDQTLKTTRDGLAEVRRALRDLRSKALVDLGLSIAVRSLAQEAADRADFALDLETAEDLPRMATDIEQAIYRIAQESFTNIIYHANARNVSLRLGIENHRFHMVIHDDGPGFDLNQIDFHNQHGLIGMQERAVMTGGKLNIKCDPGHGTQIEFMLEVPDD